MSSDYLDGFEAGRRYERETILAGTKWYINMHSHQHGSAWDRSEMADQQNTGRVGKVIAVQVSGGIGEQ